MARPLSFVLIAAIAASGVASYACGSHSPSGGFGAGAGDDGGTTGGGGDGSSGATNPTAGDSGTPGNLGGGVVNDASFGQDGAAPPLVCPNPTTQNDFTAPVIDTGAPANSAALFGAADVGSDGPCMYEPESGSLFPSNWIRMRFRFNTTHSENLFEIKLVVPHETSPLVIYTTQPNYTLHQLAWQAITTTGINAPIQVTVRSATVNASGALTGGPWAGTSGTFQIAPVPAAGSVVYWTTSNGTVLKGFQMGSEAPPQPILTPPQIGEGCVGCHTSTPDGLFVGLTASSDPGSGDGPAFIDLRSVDGGLQRPSFVSPDALKLLARQGQQAPSYSPGHWTMGDRFALSMMNVSGTTEIVWTNLEATSQTQGTAWDVLSRMSDTRFAGSASFSHDGRTVVYTSASDVSSGTNSPDGLVYTVPWNGGQGGMATPLEGASDSNYLQYNASYSHDDKFVSFNRMPMSLASASTPASYNNANAEVFIVPATGGTATRVAANDPPACLGKTSPGIMNSWAKWSPEVLSVCGNTYYWFVFSSNRDVAAGGPQLYIAPIVVDGSGKITTYSAIYFWNQPEAEHNHTPAWDVFRLPPPPPIPPPPK